MWLYPPFKFLLKAVMLLLQLLTMASTWCGVRMDVLMLRSSGRSFWQGSWGLWCVGVGGGACGCVGVMARHLNVVFAGMEMGLVVLFW